MKDEFKALLIDALRTRADSVGVLSALIEMQLAFDEAKKELGQERDPQPITKARDDARR
jgi:hypothetical protein